MEQAQVWPIRRSQRIRAPYSIKAGSKLRACKAHLLGFPAQKPALPSSRSSSVTDPGSDHISWLSSSHASKASPNSALRRMCVYKFWQNPEEFSGPERIEAPFLYSPLILYFNQSPTPQIQSLPGPPLHFCQIPASRFSHNSPSGV